MAKKQRNKEINKELGRRTLLEFPLLLLLTLIIYTVIQKIGEIYGFLPVIILTGITPSGESVILFILTIGISFLIAFVLSTYLFLRKNIDRRCMSG